MQNITLSHFIKITVCLGCWSISSVTFGSGQCPNNTGWVSDTVYNQCISPSEPGVNMEGSGIVKYYSGDQNFNNRSVYGTAVNFTGAM
ncbi:MAG TPA: hypothetical protein VHM20_00600 [Gammaproteobacteria bacterium]|nr:hypothetical protein [Gammaproteobacteria bacterium]